MDEHLTRARDINKEIARQLRPLERQVDRARKYKELSSRANELTQMLAVDELRSLQSQWNDLESRSKEGAAELELAQYRLGEKERELEKFQVMLEEKGLFVGDLGEQRRHMQDVVGRINSDMRLLEERATIWCRACPTCAARSRAPSISVVAWSRSSRMHVRSLRK